MKERVKSHLSAILFLFTIFFGGVFAQIHPHSGKAIGIPLPNTNANRGALGPVSTHGVPLPTSAGAPNTAAFGNLRVQGDAGVGLPTTVDVGGSNAQNPRFSTSQTQTVGVPLSTAAGTIPTGQTTGFKTTGAGFGVPLPTSSASNTYRVSGTTSIGRGIQETSFGTLKGKGVSTFHINELPTSVELDKNLSPVPPYFVFPDSDGDEGSLTVGGPKTGGLVPITNPTEDPKLLRLLSQPLVRQRLVAEAQADKALKISSILMAHRQVVGGQITYASVRASETNCPANRINSLRGCNIDGSQDTYICEIAFWERPWLNATKVLDEKTACRETEDDTEFDNDDDKSGRLRAVVEGKDIVRGDWRPSPTLPNGITQQQLAVEAFNYVESHSDSNFRGYLAGHKVHSVLADRARNLTKVQLLVDFGFTVCLKLDWTEGGQKDPRTCPVDETRARYSCSLSLLYHPSQLMPFRVVHGGDDKDELRCSKQPVAQNSNSPTLTASPSVAGKDLECAGCPAQAALSDPAIQSILKFAIEEYDRLYSDDRNLHKPVALLQAYTQATAGTKYVLTAEVAETLCRKNAGIVNRAQCTPDPTEETEICMFIVLHQPWLPSSHLLSANCVDKDEGQKLLASTTAQVTGVPLPTASINSGSVSSSHSVGVPLPTVSSFKPVSLSFNDRKKSNTAATALEPQTAKIVQFIVDQINQRELADDDFDSRGQDDSREFDDSRGFDDSREFGGSDSDGYYKLVKVHKVLPLNNNRERRLVIEVGETNCSKSFLPRASSAHCSLDPFEEHEVCDAIVGASNGRLQLLAITCEDLGDYLGETSLVPPVPLVTWEPEPFIPVGHLATSSRQQTNTGFSINQKPFAKMVAAPTTIPAVTKAAELVVARYNLLGGEDELAKLNGVLTAHTMTNDRGNLEYLLEVEIAETLCKKYLPIIDQSKCPVDVSEERVVCQAEVIQSPNAHAQVQNTWNGLVVNKLYCREREDYIVARNTGQGGPWTQMSLTDPKLKELASFTANQFDLRSDDDDLFIVHKIVSAKYQNVSGKRYDIILELAETVCPKYKEHINKKRCRIDPDEDIKLCNAQLFESPSGAGGISLTNLKCRKKPSSRTGSAVHSREDSHEILVLPSVHPSAHARPVFLSKFKKPQYKIHVDHSVESAESNEFVTSINLRQSTPPNTRSIVKPVVRTNRVRTRLASLETIESAESNEQFYVNPRAPGSRRRPNSRSRYDSRSEEDDSDEFLPREARRQLYGRRKRDVKSLADLIGV